MKVNLQQLPKARFNDESIATEGYIIAAPVGQDLESAGLVNLSELDLEALTK